MPIRFSKSGSSFHFGATTFAACVGLWFSSAVYAQTQPAFETTALPPAPQVPRQVFNQTDNRTSPSYQQQRQSEQNRLLMQQLTGGSVANNAHSNAVSRPTAPTTTERVDLSNLSNQSVQRLIGKPTSTFPKNATARPQARAVVRDRVRTAPNQANNIVSQLTGAPQSPAPVGRASYAQPASKTSTGVHQLTKISINQFEQKLVDHFGDKLQAKTSGDGRFVRVTLPNTTGKSIAMLVDRASGKLRYEGADGLAGQWHQFMSQLDSAELASQAPATATHLQTEIVQTQQVQQVAFQQDDPLVQGTPVQGIPGLSGPVLISQDGSGNLTLSGAPDDVAIVKREIARLSGSLARPMAGSIPLQNVRGNLIQERVQEIYDASYSEIYGQANITATDSPNSLVVVGSKEAFQAVQNLVQVLDVIKQDDVSAKDFRTFALRFISASDATVRLRTFFGQTSVAPADNRIPPTAVEVIPDFRSNQVTVKGSPTILKAANDFLSSIDVESVDNGAVNEVRVIPLKNSSASDVAIIIQNAINGQLPNRGEAFAPQSLTQPQNQNQPVAAEAQSQLRSAMLSFMTRNAQGNLTKSGFLFDVRITADFNSNSLIVTGPPSTIPLIVELVEQLDRLPDAESELKVFPLVYSDAQTIFDMLTSLFANDTQNQGQQGAGGPSQLPLQTGGGSDGASLVNLRFTIEPRSNAIIAAGPARDLQIIEDLLNRLDTRPLDNFVSATYRLSNAPAIDVAEAINSYLEGRTDLIDSDPRTQTGVPAVSRAIIVTPEAVSNSLIVRALPEYVGEIESIIKALDRRPPMVQVKVLIAEVDLDAVEEFGVELGIQDSLLFDRGTSIGAGGAITDGIGFPFNTAAIANANAAGLESVAGQALSNLGVGRVNSALGFGGLVLSAGNESVNILLRALQDRQAVRVLSKPQIMTMENLQGRVAIGASVARISGSNTTNFGLTQDITFEDVGIILEVTPRVSPDGLIVLSVNAENSSLGPEATGTAVGVGADGSIIRAQAINRTAATTTLSARSGQTVVFSGLISEQKSHIERGVPILSDLPVIGPLLKFESDSSSRTELLIIMTPTLVTSDSDLTNLNHEAMDRMHWCLSDVVDVYGSTDYGGTDIQMGEAVETYYPDADPTGTVQPYIQNSRLESPSQTMLGRESEMSSQSVARSRMDESPRHAAPMRSGSNVRSAQQPRWKRFDRR